MNFWNEWQSRRRPHLTALGLEEDEVKRVMRLEYQGLKSEDCGPPEWLAGLHPDALRELCAVKEAAGSIEEALDGILTGAYTYTPTSAPERFDAVIWRPGGGLGLARAVIERPTAFMGRACVRVTLRSPEGDTMSELILFRDDADDV